MRSSRRTAARRWARCVPGRSRRGQEGGQCNGPKRCLWRPIHSAAARKCSSGNCTLLIQASVIQRHLEEGKTEISFTIVLESGEANTAGVRVQVVYFYCNIGRHLCVNYVLDSKSSIYYINRHRPLPYSVANLKISSLLFKYLKIFFDKLSYSVNCACCINYHVTLLRAPSLILTAAKK